MQLSSTGSNHKVNKTRYALLGILTERECTGYEMKKIMENSLIYFWNESFGQIYPTLKQMQAEGLVQVREQVVGQKTRYLYSITNKGKEALRDWLAIPPAPELVRNELLLKMFFAQPQDKSLILEHIAGQKDHDMRLLQLFEALQCQINTGGVPVSPYRQLTLEYGLRAIHAELGWLTYAEKVISSS